MIASEVQLCSTCGHPIKEKEDGSWRHTNSIDGHVFTTKACQQCIAEGRDCRNAQPQNMEVSVTGTAGEEALPRVPKVKEEHYLICRICGIYAISQGALMLHYREKHPVDRKELMRLYKEGKTVEEMAAILERTPATIRYHLQKLPEIPEEPKPAAPSDDDIRHQNAELKKEVEDLRQKIREIQEKPSGWTRVFHLESSGDGAHEGVQAVRNAIKSALPYFPLSISLDVESNKELHSTRIFVEVRTK